MTARPRLFSATLTASLALTSPAAWADQPAPVDQAPPAQAVEPAAADNAPGFLGVGVSESTGLTRDEAKAFAFPAGSPVLVVDSVHPDSPAAFVGLLPGDLLLNIDGQHLLHPVQFRRLVGSYGADAPATLGYARDGQYRESDITFAARPADLIDANPLGWGPQLDFEPFARVQPVAPGDERNLDPQVQDLLEHLEMQGDWEQIQRDMQQQMQKMRERLRQQFEENDLERGPFQGLQLGGNHTSVIVQDDGTHRLTIRTDAEGKHLKATDGAGNVLFDGPIDTAEQLETVPAEIRQKLPSAEPKNDPQGAPGSELPAGRSA